MSKPHAISIVATDEHTSEFDRDFGAEVVTDQFGKMWALYGDTSHVREDLGGLAREWGQGVVYVYESGAVSSYSDLELTEA